VSLDHRVEVTLESQNLRIEGSGRLQRQLESKGCQVEWML
jgi:hypothetical protein